MAVTAKTASISRTWLRNNFYNILLLVRIVSTAVRCIKLEQIHQRNLLRFLHLTLVSLDDIVEEGHGRIKRDRLVRFGSFALGDEAEEFGELAAVVLLVSIPRLFENTQDLACINRIHSLCLIDLHARKYGELAHVKVYPFDLVHASAVADLVPIKAVEELREVDDLADEIVCNHSVELRKTFG